LWTNGKLAAPEAVSALMSSALTRWFDKNRCHNGCGVTLVEDIDNLVELLVGEEIPSSAEAEQDKNNKNKKKAERRV
jgi:hypothetical protein